MAKKRTGNTYGLEQYLKSKEAKEATSAVSAPKAAVPATAAPVPKAAAPAPKAAVRAPITTAPTLPSAATPVTSPYAFIPFGAEPKRTDIKATYGSPDKLLTGWIDIKLTARTRLIIPDGTEQEKKKDPIKSDHYHYHFYRAGNNLTPIIPGSEIRGLLRSVYETASNSCVAFLLDDKDDKLKTMRLPNYVAIRDRGLLGRKNGKWVLWSVEDGRDPLRSTRDLEDIKATGTYKGKEPGDEATFYLDRVSHIATPAKPGNPGAEDGYIHFSAPVIDKIDPPHFKSRNHYSIHYVIPDEEIFSWKDDSPYDTLFEELNHAGDSDRKSITDYPTKVLYQRLLGRLNRVKQQKAEFFPVWYFKAMIGGEKKYYLSVASIGRINQFRQWDEILEPYTPCTCGESSCPACQLFGQVKGEWNVRGRVRIGDAVPVGDLHMGYSTLPILGGPKPSAFEMYINRPANAKFWNYDIYSTTVQANTNFKVREDFSPRGRKFYWHIDDPSVMKSKNGEKSGQNATMEWADKGSAFRFRLHFDRITEQQLKELLWVITLGENKEDSKFCHKLGHGKPVGYGSVKLVVEGLSLRKFSNENARLPNYRICAMKVPEVFGCPFSREYNAQLRDLLTISRFNAIPSEKACYPRLTPDGKIFQWYSKNRTVNKYNEPAALPAITEMAKASSVNYETPENALSLTPT